MYTPILFIVFGLFCFTLGIGALAFWQHCIKWQRRDRIIKARRKPARVIEIDPCIFEDNIPRWKEGHIN